MLCPWWGTTEKFGIINHIKVSWSLLKDFRFESLAKLKNSWPPISVSCLLVDCRQLSVNRLQQTKTWKSAEKDNWQSANKEPIVEPSAQISPQKISDFCHQVAAFFQIAHSFYSATNNFFLAIVIMHKNRPLPEENSNYEY